MATALATPFYLEMGYTKTEIGIVAKNAGLWASVVGGMLGGLWMVKIGINRGLWLFGVVQMVSILGFAWLATLGATNLCALGVVIAFEALGVGPRHRSLRGVHRTRDRPALHRHAVRAVHEPVCGAAHAHQRDDRHGSWRKSGGSTSSCCVRCLRYPEWHYSCVSLPGEETPGETDRR